MQAGYIAISFTIEIVMDTQKQNVGQVVVSCLQTMREQNSVWDALRIVLRKLGEYTNADAGMVIHFDGIHNQGDIVSSYEKDGNANAIRGLERTLLSPVEVAYKYYADQEVMELDDINVFSQLCGICCQLSSLTPLHKFYGVRLMIGGKVWGSLCILFNDKTKKISADELEMMKVLAYTAENSIMHELAHRNAVNENDHALAAERAKQFFFASVSHHIRTPLNSIMGFTELLKSDIDGNDRLQYLENIISSGRDLRQIVDNVLELSKMAVGRPVLHPDFSDVRGICREASSRYAAVANEKGVELRFELPEAMPSVGIDHERVRHILDMLLSNAIKYTDAGSITVKAELNGIVDGKGTLHLAVIDTGCGIDAAHQQRLLRPYEELGDNHSQMGGTGLSLALCRALVEIMGGNIYLHSEQGKGSVFGMYLPVDVQVEEKKAVASACSIHGEASGIGSAEPCPCETFTVLIVDDVPLNLKLLDAYCKKVGVRHILEASNAVKALKILDTTKVDCILTDIWMPAMDGVGLARNLRENQAWNGIPIYAITADVDFPDSEDAKLFTGVMLKPVGADKLLPLFRSLIY